MSRERFLRCDIDMPCRGNDKAKISHAPYNSRLAPFHEGPWSRPGEPALFRGDRREIFNTSFLGNIPAVMGRRLDVIMQFLYEGGASLNSPCTVSQCVHVMKGWKVQLRIHERFWDDDCLNVLHQYNVDPSVFDDADKELIKGWLKKYEELLQGSARVLFAYLATQSFRDLVVPGNRLALDRREYRTSSRHHAAPQDSSLCSIRQ